MSDAVGMAVKHIPEAQVVILGSKCDIEQCLRVEAALGQDIKYFNTAGLTSLPEYVAIIDQCLFLITNDSSALHTADR